MKNVPHGRNRVRPHLLVALAATWATGTTVVPGRAAEMHRVVADATIASLPPPLDRFFAEHGRRFRECVEEASDTIGDAPGAAGFNRHHIALDAGPDTETAARAPDRADLESSMVKPRGGATLPGTVVERFDRLVIAFGTRRPDAIVCAAGSLTHVAADAAMPLRTLTDPRGQQAGNLIIRPTAADDPVYADANVDRRFADGLLRWMQARGTLSVSVSPSMWRAVDDPAARVVRLAHVAHDGAETLLEADRQSTRKLGITDAPTFALNRESYYQSMERRCGALAVRCVREATTATGELILAAWIRAGRPQLTGRQAQAPSPAKNVELVGSKHSDVYHRADCQHVRRIKPTNRVVFSSPGLAVGQGRRACKVCRPPAPTDTTPKKK